MSLLHFASPKILHRPLSNVRRPSSSSGPFPTVPAAGANIPARDHVIDFGKHRGRMLGSLPSAAHRRNSDSPIANLLAMSDRSGWDNEDKEAWARIDFELLGTSLGGRIPRRAANGEKSFPEMGRGSGGKGNGGTLGTKVGGLRDGRRFVVREEVDEEEEEVRLGMKERREKRKERRVGMQKLMKEVGRGRRWEK